MKLKNINQINDLINVLNECQGNVWLESYTGQVYSLNSRVDIYAGVGALLGEHGDELELFASSKEDQARLYKWIVSDNVAGKSIA